MSKLYIPCTTRTWIGERPGPWCSRRFQGVQQKEVGPEPAAVPIGAPPPERVQEPASVMVGTLTSFTVSGGMNAVHGLGAESVLPEAGHRVSMAGEAMVHVPPVGLPQSHAEQPRWSSTPEKKTCGPEGYPAGHAVAVPGCITHSAVEKGLAGPGAHSSPEGQPPEAGADDGAQARATVAQVGAVMVAVPPVVVQVPPVAEGAETVTAEAPMYEVVAEHDVEMVFMPNAGDAQEVSR